MFILLRSITYHLFFVFWTFSFALVTWPVLLLSSESVGRIGKFWAHTSTVALKYIVGLKVEFRGVENIPKSEPYIFASKHQSTLETIAIHKLIPSLVMIAKRELIFVPIFGWYLWRSNMVIVKRNAQGSSIPSMVEGAKKSYEKNYNVAIYPQGTRVGISDYKPYKRGILALYRAFNIPILPVAINAGCYWPRRSISIYPGTAIIEFLPLIPSRLSDDDVMEKLEHDIEVHTKLLVSEARNTLSKTTP